jgi:hypothetical protein
MTKAEVKAWKARWELVNQMDLDAAKRVSPEERYRGLLQMMRFALSFPVTRQRKGEERAAAARWRKLRKAYHARLATL